MQHISLQKKKNQYIDFFTYRIYIIYYNIITLFWGEFETIIHLTKKKWCQIFMRNCTTLRLVTNINWDKSKMISGIIWAMYLNEYTN